MQSNDVSKQDAQARTKCEAVELIFPRGGSLHSTTHHALIVDNSETIRETTKITNK